MTARVDDCCGDPKNCRDYGCVIFSAYRRVQPARFFGASRPNTELALPYVPQPHCPGCACPPNETCWDRKRSGRKVGLFERLIAGPQGDPTLKEDFLSFLGCVACGTGLAVLLIAIVMFFRIVTP